MNNFINLRPWKLPDRYQTKPNDSWHTRNYYEWTKPMQILEPTDKSIIEGKPRTRALAELLESKAATALHRIAEIERDVHDGIISEAEGVDLLKAVRRWLIANIYKLNDQLSGPAKATDRLSWPWISTNRFYPN